MVVKRGIKHSPGSVGGVGSENQSGGKHRGEHSAAWAATSVRNGNHPPPHFFLHAVRDSDSYPVMPDQRAIPMERRTALSLPTLFALAAAAAGATPPRAVAGWTKISAVRKIPSAIPNIPSAEPETFSAVPDIFSAVPIFPSAAPKTHAAAPVFLALGTKSLAVIPNIPSAHRIFPAGDRIFLTAHSTSFATGSISMDCRISTKN